MGCAAVCAVTYRFWKPPYPAGACMKSPGSLDLPADTKRVLEDDATGGDAFRPVPAGGLCLTLGWSPPLASDRSMPNRAMSDGRVRCALAFGFLEAR